MSKKLRLITIILVLIAINVLNIYVSDYYDNNILKKIFSQDIFSIKVYGNGEGSNYSDYFNEVSIYSIKYISSFNDGDIKKNISNVEVNSNESIIEHNFKNIFKLIDNKGETYIETTGSDGAGIYFDKKQEIVKIDVNVLEIEGVDSENKVNQRNGNFKNNEYKGNSYITIYYIKGGKVEFERGKYYLQKGKNEIYINKIFTDNILIKFNFKGKIGGIKFYSLSDTGYTGPLKLKTHAKLKYLNKIGKKICDNDIINYTTLYKYYITSNGVYLKTDNFADVEYLKIWGYIPAFLRVKVKNREGKYIEILKDIDGTKFYRNKFNKISLNIDEDFKSRNKIDKVNDILLEFYNFKRKMVRINEIELWGKGARESSLLNGIRNNIDSSYNYNIDGFILDDAKNIENGYINLDVGTKTYIFLNYRFLGVFEGNSLIRVSSSYFRSGFNLIEYLSPSGKVKVNFFKVYPLYKNGKLNYFCDTNLLNDGKVDKGVLKEKQYLLLKGHSSIDRVRIYGYLDLDKDGKDDFYSKGKNKDSGGKEKDRIKKELSIYFNGKKIEYSLNLKEGMIEIVPLEEYKNTGIIRIKGNIKYYEVEIYGTKYFNYYIKGANKGIYTFENGDETKLFDEVKKVRGIDIDDDINGNNEKNNKENKNNFNNNTYSCNNIKDWTDVINDDVLKIAEENIENDDTLSTIINLYAGSDEFYNEGEVLKQKGEFDSRITSTLSCERTIKNIVDKKGYETRYGYDTFNKIVQYFKIRQLKEINGNGNGYQKDNTGNSNYIHYFSDGIIKAGKRYLTLFNSNWDIDHIIYNGKEYDFKDGICDIEIKIDDGENEYLLSTYNFEGVRREVKIKLEGLSKKIKVKGDAYFRRINDKFYVVFSKTGKVSFLKYLTRLSNGASIYKYSTEKQLYSDNIDPDISFNNSADSNNNDATLCFGYYISKDEKNKIDIALYDKAGNRYNYEDFIDYDTTPPEINEVIYPENWVNYDPLIKIDAKDEESGISYVVIYLNGEFNNQIVYSFEQGKDRYVINDELAIINAIDGKNRVKVEVSNRLGEFASKEFYVYIDKSSAIINFAENFGQYNYNKDDGNYYTNKRQIGLEFSAKEYSIEQLKINGISQSFENVLKSIDIGGQVYSKQQAISSGYIGDTGIDLAGSYGECEFENKQDLKEGDNIVSVFVKDKAGNVSVNSANFVCDTIAPEIIVLNKDEAYNKERIELEIKIKDANPDKVYIDGEQCYVKEVEGEKIYSRWIKFKVEGDNSFVIKAVDKAGNESSINWIGIYDITPPGAVKNFKVNYDGKINLLSFEKPTEDTVSYKIEKEVYHLDENGALIGEVEHFEYKTDQDRSKNDCSFSDDGSDEKPAYEGEAFRYNVYTVYAIDHAGNIGPGSARKNKVIGDVKENEDTVVENDVDKVSVKIKGNSVENIKKIAMSVSKNNDKEKDYDSGVYINLEPEGVEFKDYVELTIDVKSLEASSSTIKEKVVEPENMILYYYDKEAGEWKPELTYYDSESGKLKGFIHHFSTYKFDIPEMSAQIKKGIVSGNNYFSFNNEYVDEGSGIVYVDRTEEVLKSSNGVSFELKGLFSSDGVNSKIAPVSSNYGYMIPYIENGYLHLENGGSYKLFFVNGRCIYNREIYFEAEVIDSAGQKSINVYFKDGTKYSFDAEGYFKGEVHKLKGSQVKNYLKAISAGLDALSGIGNNDYVDIGYNLYNKDIIAPLKRIEDFTGQNHIDFYYTKREYSKKYEMYVTEKTIWTENGHTHTETKKYWKEDTDNSKNIDVPQIEHIEVYSAGQLQKKYFFNYNDTVLTMTKYLSDKYRQTEKYSTVNSIKKVSAISDNNYFSKNLSQYDVVNIDRTISDNRETITLIKGGRKVQVRTEYRSLTKWDIDNIEILNDEGGRSYYLFERKSFSKPYENENKDFERDVCIKKISYNKNWQVHAKIEFEYFQSKGGYKDRFTSTLVSYYGANGLKKRVYNEYMKIFNTKQVSDKDNNKLLKSYTFMGEGSSFYTKEGTDLFSSDGEYVEYNHNNDGNVRIENKSFYEGLRSINSAYGSGYTISAGSNNSFIQLKKGNKTIKIYEDKIEVKKEGKILFIFPYSKTIDTTGYTIYKSSEIINGAKFEYRIVIDRINGKMVVYKQIYAKEGKDINGESFVSGYSGRVSRIVKKDYSTESSGTTIEDVSYSYDNKGNVVKIEKNNEIDEKGYKRLNNGNKFKYVAEYDVVYYKDAAKKYLKIYGYDEDSGNVKEVSDCGYIGAATVLNNTTLENLKQEVENKGRVDYYTYDSAGRMKSSISRTGLKKEYTYNSGYPQPVQIITKTANNTPLTKQMIVFDTVFDTILKNISYIYENKNFRKTNETSFEYYNTGDIKREIGNNTTYLDNEGKIFKTPVKTFYLFSKNIVGVISYVDRFNENIEAELEQLSQSYISTFNDDFINNNNINVKEYIFSETESFLNNNKGTKAEGITSFNLYEFDGLSHIIGIYNYNFENSNNNNNINVNSILDPSTKIWKQYTIKIGYDSLGNRISMTYPSGKILKRVYDALSRVKEVYLNISAMSNNTNNTNQYIIPSNLNVDNDGDIKLYEIEYLWGSFTDITNNPVNKIKYTKYSIKNSNKYIIEKYTDIDGFDLKYKKYFNDSLLNYKTNEYNDLKQLTETVEYSSDGNLSYAIDYEYDKYGNQAKILYPESQYLEPFVSYIGGKYELNGVDNIITKRKEIESEFNNLNKKIEESLKVNIDGSEKTLKTKYEYNIYGEVIKKTYFDGSYEEYGYDKQGRKVYFKDVDGQISFKIYDDKGRLIATRGKNKDSYTYYLYDISGKLKATIGSNGLYYNYEPPYIDDNNTGLYKKNPSFIISLKGYQNVLNDFISNNNNSNNEITLTEDLQKTMVINYYDNSGRVIYKKDRRGNFVFNIYDIDSNLVKQIIYYHSDAKQIITKEIKYDVLGNAVQIRDKDKITKKYIYDGFNRLEKEYIVSNKGNRRLNKHYQYDIYGNVVKIYTQKGTGEKLIKSITYDGLSRKIEEINESGIKKQYFYNSDGTVKKVKVISSDNKSYEINYSYDRTGNVTKKDNAGVITYNAIGFENIDNKEKYINYEIYPYDSFSIDENQTSGGNLKYVFNKVVYKDIKDVEYIKRSDGVIVVPEIDFNLSKDIVLKEDIDNNLKEYIKNKNIKYFVMNKMNYFKDYSLYDQWKENKDLFYKQWENEKESLEGKYEFKKTISTPANLPVLVSTESNIKTMFIYNDYDEPVKKLDYINGKKYEQKLKYDNKGILKYASLVKTEQDSDFKYIENTYDDFLNFKSTTGLFDISFNGFMQIGDIEYSNGTKIGYDYDERFRLNSISVTQNDVILYKENLIFNEKNQIEKIEETGKYLQKIGINLSKSTKEFSYDGFGRLIEANLTMPIETKMELSANKNDIYYISKDFYPQISKDETNKYLSGSNFDLGLDDGSNTTNTTSNDNNNTWHIDETKDKDNNNNEVLNTNWYIDMSENSIIFNLSKNGEKINNVKEAGIYYSLYSITSDSTELNNKYSQILEKFNKSLFEVYYNDDGTWIFLDKSKYNFILEKGIIRIKFNNNMNNLKQLKLHYLEDIKKVVFNKSETGEDISLQVSSYDEYAKILPEGRGYIVVDAGNVNITYTYDERGNILTKKKVIGNYTIIETFTYSTLTNRLLTSKKESYSANSNERYLIESFRYIYDLNGSLIKKISLIRDEKEKYIYNLKMRLIEYTKIISDKIVSYGKYLYNGLNERVCKDTFNKDNKLKEVMVYDVKGNIGYIEKDNGKEKTSFSYLFLFLVPLVRIKRKDKDGSLSFISQSESITFDNETIEVIKEFSKKALLFYYYNYIKSLKFTMDGEGKIEQCFEYYPYGDVAKEWNSKNDISNLNNNNNTNVVEETNSIEEVSPIFASHMQDVESGNYYAKNRYYLSGLARFNRVDPAKDGINYYAYSGGDPVGKFDPLGLSSINNEMNPYGFTENDNQEIGVINIKDKNDITWYYNKYADGTYSYDYKIENKTTLYYNNGTSKTIKNNITDTTLSNNTNNNKDNDIKDTDTDSNENDVQFTEYNDESEKTGYGNDINSSNDNIDNIIKEMERNLRKILINNKKVVKTITDNLDEGLLQIKYLENGIKGYSKDGKIIIKGKVKNVLEKNIRIINKDTFFRYGVKFYLMDTFGYTAIFTLVTDIGLSLIDDGDISKEEMIDIVTDLIVNEMSAGGSLVASLLAVYWFPFTITVFPAMEIALGYGIQKGLEAIGAKGFIRNYIASPIVNSIYQNNSNNPNNNNLLNFPEIYNICPGM